MVNDKYIKENIEINEIIKSLSHLYLSKINFENSKKLLKHKIFKIMNHIKPFFYNYSLLRDGIFIINSIYIKNEKMLNCFKSYKFDEDITPILLLTIFYKKNSVCDIKNFNLIELCICSLIYNFMYRNEITLYDIQYNEQPKQKLNNKIYDISFLFKE